jgi:NAD+ synthetase
MKAYQESLAEFFQELEEDVTEQNIQARIRGNLLMALSNKFGHLLLATGNKSEMAVGYCTLYGDMSGGLAVLADVPKVMVYALARLFNKGEEMIPERIITRPPTAELKPDQYDQDDLPPYEILDPILTGYLEEQLGIDELVARGYEKKVVEDIVHRIRINEHKRKQAPLGLKVTSKAFGYGRRYPIVQRFVG